MPLRAAWRWVSNPDYERRMQNDLKRFSRQYRWLSARPPEGPARGRALVVGLHEFAPSATEEAVFLKALEWHGWEPAVLVSRGSRLAAYYRRFGFRRILYWEDWIFRVPESAWRSTYERWLFQGSFEDPIGWRYRQSHTGRHVVSTVMRQLHRGSLELADAAQREVLARVLAQSLCATHAAESMMDSVQPDMLIFNERGYTPFGEIFDAALARNRRVIQWVASHRDDARMFKAYTAQTHSEHPSSLSDDTWQVALSMPWTDVQEQQVMRQLHKHYAEGTWFNFQRIQHEKQLLRRTEALQQLGLNAAKPVAVIFSHMLWDATHFYGESLFADYEAWFIDTVRAACGNSDVQWVVKLHPVNVWRVEADGYKGALAEHVILRKHFGELPGHVRLMEPNHPLSTASLFDVADYCLTVRGTIGLEMACHGVPVLTAGTGRYSGKDFTVDSVTIGEYQQRLAQITKIPRLSSRQISLARRFLYALLFWRPLPFTSVRPVYTSGPETFHALNGRVELKASSLNELMQSEDLQAFVRWAQSPALDYLEPEGLACAAAAAKTQRAEALA